jgi:HD-GYP domain-containing protein (c-di-GMP phosphodiesterase class II)
MNAADDGFFHFILDTQKINYALFDESLGLFKQSTNLKSSLSGDPPLENGTKVASIFPELGGYEDILVKVIQNKHNPLVLERIIKMPRLHHHAPLDESQAEYYCLQAYPFEGSLLIITRDVTNEGNLEQQVMQQRNEMDLINFHLIEDLRQANEDLNQAYLTTLTGWAAALDLRYSETPGHSDRLVRLTKRLAESIGLSREDLKFIGYGALLHDIGEMSIPDAILRKPGKLTKDEWEIMSWHPTYGYNLLSPIKYLQQSLDIPHYHHEKWDGSGYPDGLKEEEIPLSARIFAVVDVYDALTSRRPNREAWTHEEALTYIREQAGAHFDPTIVRYFLSVIEAD